MISISARIAAAGVALLLFASLAGAQEIRLGYLQATAGPFATLSKTNELAAQIAVDQINSGGGIGGRKIHIVRFDTAGKPDQAVIGIRKLTEDDKVLAVIGPFSSGECRVVFPTGERLGIVSMSMGSSAPKLAEPYTYAFRNTSDEGYLFSKLLKTMKARNIEMKTASVAYATDDVVSKTMGEVIIPNQLKGSGVEVTTAVTFQTQAFDLSPQVSQIMSKPTDVVGVGAGPESAIRIAQELRRQGYRGRIVGGSTISDPELAKRMGPAGDGTMFPTAFYPGLNERTKAFDDELVRRAKDAGIDRTSASQFDASTYSIVMLYAEAMRKASVTGAASNLAAERTAIRDQLRALKDFPAIEGSITFQKSGDALKSSYIIEIANSDFKLIDTHQVD